MRRSLVACGTCCIACGLILLALAVIGLIPVAAFSLGGESGFRVIGTLAVFGCIMAAIGYSDD